MKPIFLVLDLIRKKKLSVVYSKGYFHCWVCGIGGNLIFLQKYIDTQDKAEFQTLIKQLNPQSGDSRPSAEAPTIHQLYIKESFKSLAQVNQDDQNVTPRRILKYLEARGVTQEQIHYYGLQYASEGDYKNYVIIPSYDRNHKLNYFTGRIAITKKVDIPYKNPPINRINIIFNEYYINWKQPLIICEGPFDWISLHTFNRVALLGSELHENNILFREILKNKIPIILMLDVDAQKKSKRIEQLLSKWGIKVSSISLAQFNVKDPGELNLKQKEELKKYV